MIELFIILGIFIIVATFTVVFTYRISTGTDKPTVKHKEKALDFVKAHILKDENATVMRHIIKGGNDHIIIIKRNNQYHEIELRGISDTFFYTMEELTTHDTYTKK